MPYSSLRDFIKAAENVGEVAHVDGADLELDVGCLTELMGERNGPMLVFDNLQAIRPVTECARTRSGRRAVFRSRWTCRSTFIH